MDDESSTKRELIQEISSLRKRIRELEQSDAERRRMEETLRSSQEAANAILNTSNDSIFLVDTCGSILMANKASARRFRTQPSELLGRTVFDLFPVDKAEMLRAFAGEVIRAGRPVQFEQELAGMYFDVRAYPLFDDAGHVTKGVVYATDITDRKKAEGGYRAAYQRLLDIIEFLPDATMVIDKDRNIVAWNKAIEELTGVKAEDMIGKGDHEYAVPFYGEPRPILIDLVWEPAEEIEKRYAYIERHGNRLSGEAFMPNLRGGSVYLYGSASALRDDNGEIVGAIESIRDISDQKYGELALRRSEKTVKTLLNANPETMLLVDTEGVILSGNDTFPRKIGKSIEELMGTCLYGHFPPDVQEERRLYVQTAAHSRHLVNFTDSRDGKTYDNYYYPVFNNAGDVEQIAIFAVDITQRKNLEAQLRQSQKMQSIGTLAGGVAHDFNNILTALIGYGHILRMKIDNHDPLQVYVDQILQTSQRAVSLTQSLLAFSRKQAIEPKVCTINNVIKGIEQLLRRLLTEDIELRITPSDEDATVMADVSQLDQVLINLATNARDAMTNGGTLTIQAQQITLNNRFVRAHGYGRPGRYACLSITDTGCGMDETTQERIFEPFFTTKEVGKGTGLGLSIVYGIVKQHNGYIDVESEIGRGTTFRIYLPVVSGRTNAVEAVPAPAQGGTETILLAEDSAPVRRLIREILTGSGYSVIEAVDGEDAIRKFMEHRDRIALVITDVVMPKKNGKEACEGIRKINADIRLIFMSGYTGDVVVEKGIRDDSVEFMRKPVTPNQLLLKVRAVLDK